MLICPFQIFSPPTIASKRDTRWSLYGWIKVRYLAYFWPCLSYYLLSRGLCWANYSSREHSWVFSSSSLHWDSCFLDWLIISCNYQCLVHLPSPVSWFLLLSWWCTSIVFFVINVDELLRITTHQYTWFSFSDFNLKKNRTEKGKLISKLTRTYYLHELPYILTFLLNAGCCLAPSLAVTLSVVLCHPHHEKKPSWGADLAICIEQNSELFTNK